MSYIQLQRCAQEPRNVFQSSAFKIEASPPCVKDGLVQSLGSPHLSFAYLRRSSTDQRIESLYSSLPWLQNSQAGIYPLAVVMKNVDDWTGVGDHFEEIEDLNSDQQITIAPRFIDGYVRYNFLVPNKPLLVSKRRIRYTYSLWTEFMTGHGDVFVDMFERFTRRPLGESYPVGEMDIMFFDKQLNSTSVDANIKDGYAKLYAAMAINYSQGQRSVWINQILPRKDQLPYQLSAGEFSTDVTRIWDVVRANGNKMPTVDVYFSLSEITSDPQTMIPTASAPSSSESQSTSGLSAGWIIAIVVAAVFVIVIVIFLAMSPRGNLSGNLSSPQSRPGNVEMQGVGL